MIDSLYLSNKKDISYEVMRTIACFFVVAIHVFSSYFSLFNKIKLISWLYANGIMSISKFSVPLFVMITGAILLKKEVTIKKSLQRFIKMFVVLLIWSIAYVLIIDILLKKGSYTAYQITKIFLNNKIAGHFWYLYMLLGLYLILPFAKLIVEKEKILKYYLVMFIAYSLLTMMSSISVHLFNQQIYFYMQIPMMTWPLACLLLGFFIDNKIKISKHILIFNLAGLIICDITTIGLTYFISAKSNSANQNYFSNSYFNIFLAAACIFYIIKYLSKYIIHGSFLSKFFYFIGSISLEIYLVHSFIIIYYDKYLALYFSKKINKIYIKYSIELLLIFILSVLAAFLIKVIIKSFYKKIKEVLN